ncbi:hypothetical protein [Paenibacillus wynnii]|uniref:hypothetical protein n=1 Tax=Paenibacillus wynnii TaxID=268407 RepID=UPI001969DC59
MSDVSGNFDRWKEEGKYLAGCEVKDNETSPNIVQRLCDPLDTARIDRFHSLFPASFFLRHRPKVAIFLLRQMLHRVFYYTY